MKRFTVSLEEETYERLLAAAADRTPPATLQQMIRYAVEALLGTSEVSSSPPEEPFDDWDDAPEAEELEKVAEPSDLSTFRVGGVWFGLPVTLVEGIAARSSVEPLPAGRHDVAGAIRYRDTLIAVVDGAARLHTSPVDPDNAQHLVVRHPDGLVALAVDEVGALVPKSGGQWHPPPPGTAADLAMVGVSAVVDCGDRLVNVLEGVAL